MRSIGRVMVSIEETALGLLRRLFPVRRPETVVVGPPGAPLRRAVFDLLQDGFAARARPLSSDDAGSLVRVVDEEDADLLLLPPPPAPGLLHALSGDVAERVLRSSDVPVALARGPADAPIRHLVVPLDGGDVGRAALPVVEALARGLDARVTLVHVNSGGRAHPRWTREWTSIGAAEHGLRAALVPVSTSTRRGRPAAEILRACETERGDLLVMGTRARLTPARRLLGSVTETLLHGSPAPIVLVPVHVRTAATPEPVVGVAGLR